MMCGGIGNGINNKYKAIYFTNKHFNEHLRGFTRFKHLVATSNVFSIEIYRRNSIVLCHIIFRYDHYHDEANKEELDKLNEKIKKETSYEDLDELFEEGMSFTFIFVSQILSKNEFNTLLFCIIFVSQN